MRSIGGAKLLGQDSGKLGGDVFKAWESCINSRFRWAEVRAEIKPISKGKTVLRTSKRVPLTKNNPSASLICALGLWEIIRLDLVCQESYELFRKNLVTVMGHLTRITRLSERLRGVELGDERLRKHFDFE